MLGLDPSVRSAKHIHLSGFGLTVKRGEGHSDDNAVVQLFDLDGYGLGILQLFTCHWESPL